MPLNSNNLVVQNFPGLKIEPMLGKDWKKVMAIGWTAMKLSGFQVQLGSGTLLGAIREEDHFIHHDTDIDIDVIVEEATDLEFYKKVNDMVESMKGLGFKLVRTQQYQGLPMQVAFIYEENDVLFDLCFFYKKWGTDYCNIYEHGVFLRPDYSVSRTTNLNLDGVKYTIPQDHDKYLTGRYGSDWRTPKTAKESGEKDAANYLIVL